MNGTLPITAPILRRYQDAWLWFGSEDTPILRWLTSSQRVRVALVSRNPRDRVVLEYRIANGPPRTLELIRRVGPTGGFRPAGVPSEEQVTYFEGALRGLPARKEVSYDLELMRGDQRLRPSKDAGLDAELKFVFVPPGATRPIIPAFISSANVVPAPTTIIGRGAGRPITAALVHSVARSVSSEKLRAKGEALQAQAQAEGNLFKIQKGGFQAWAHGKAFATASASFHRGFELGFDTGASIDLGVSGQVVGVVGKLRAGAGIDLATKVQIGFPLDLFTEAGLIARVQIIAEAAAFARLDVNLQLGEFTKQLTARLPHAWGTLIQIFLEEVDIGAGIFGRVAFAAEIVGEAVLVGSLLPAPGGTTSGFTFSGHYAFGYIFGAGGHVVHNFDISDSTRLLNRLSKELTAIVQAEVTKDLQALENSDPALAKVVRQAAPFLDLLMPLVSRALFELASSLVATAVADHPTTTPKQVVQSFLSDVRAFAMQKVLEFALRELRKLLAQLRPAIQSLTNATQQKAATDAISSARDAATKLMSAPLSSPDVWLDTVLSLIGAFDNFLSLGIIDQSKANRLQVLTADIWAGAMLLRAGIEWQQAPSGQAASFLAGAVKVPPGDSVVAAFVGAKVGKSPNALTLTDIVNYLVGQVPESDVIASIPELEKVFGWLKSLLGSLGTQPGSKLFSLVLVSIDAINAAQIQNLLPQLTAGLADAVDNQLTPNIFSRLSSNPEAGEVISQIVEPTLKSIVRVILPSLGNLGTDDGARRLREAVSSVLLQLLTRLITESSAVLIERGIEQAIPAAENLATEIENQGSSHPLFNELSMAASAAVLGTPLTATDLANLLRASEAVLKLAQPALPKILKDIEGIVSLGVTVGQPQLQQIWNNIATTDNPPDQGALNRLFADSGNLVVNVAWEIIQRLPNALVQHYVSVAKTIIATVEQAAKVAFKAAEDVIKKLEADINAIERDIQKLAGDVANLVGNLAGALQAIDQRIVGLIDGLVGQIQADGWALISPVVPDFLKGPAQDIYNGIFSGLRFLLDEPLRVLGAVAGWIHDAVMATVGTGGRVTAQSLKDAIRVQILNAVVNDMSFTISIPIPFDGSKDLGTITLPGASILGRIAGTVVGELENLLGGSGGVVDIGNTLSNTQQQLASNQAVQATYTSQADAAKAVNGMKTGYTPTINISSPTDGSVYSDTVGLIVSVTGINPTFLIPALGVPRRVRIYFNGVEYDYASADWYQFGGDQIFSAQLVPSARGLVARPVIGVPWTVKLNPAGDGTWVNRESQNFASLMGARRRTSRPAASRMASALGVLARSRSTTAGTSQTGAAGLGGSESQTVGGYQGGGAYGGGVTYEGIGQTPSQAGSASFQFVPAGALLAPAGPTIVLRRGLNTMQVIVVEGDENDANTATALVHFFLKQTDFIPPPPPLPTMSVRVSALKTIGPMHSIGITVADSTTGASITGATISVSDTSSGEITASGTTAANGTVTISYPRCALPERKKLVPVPCQGSVHAAGYADATFDAP